MMGGARPGDQQDGGNESRAEWGLMEEREKACGGDGSGSRLKVFTPVAVGRKVLKEASVTLSGRGRKLIHTSRQELLVIKSGRVGEGAEGPAEPLRRRHGQDLVTEPGSQAAGGLTWMRSGDFYQVLDGTSRVCSWACELQALRYLSRKR